MNASASTRNVTGCLSFGGGRSSAVVANGSGWHATRESCHARSGVDKNVCHTVACVCQLRIWLKPRRTDAQHGPTLMQACVSMVASARMSMSAMLAYQDETSWRHRIWRRYLTEQKFC